MMPRFAIQGSCIAASDYEAEGRVLQIQWFGLVFEIAFYRIVRRFDV